MTIWDDGRVITVAKVAGFLCVGVGRGGKGQYVGFKSRFTVSRGLVFISVIFWEVRHVRQPLYTRFSALGGSLFF